MDIDEIINKISNNEIQIEDISFPPEIGDPDKMFSELLSFYDEKIKKIEEKIAELNKSKYSVEIKEEYFTQDPIIKRYMEKGILPENKVNQYKQEAKNEIKAIKQKNIEEDMLPELEKYLEALKSEKENFDRASKQLKEFIVKVNSKKEKFEKKKTSLINLKIKDFGKFQKERDKIKNKILDNLSKLKNAIQNNKKNDDEIERLENEAEKYYSQLQQKKLIIKTYTETTTNYCLVAAFIGVALGGIIAGGCLACALL